jgi:hypothetical protein
MGFLQSIYGAIKTALTAVPGGTATVLPILVAWVTKLGFHVTTTNLTVIMTIVSAVVGYLVHVGVKTTANKAVVQAIMNQ